jgi:hypothetical protein
LLPTLSAKIEIDARTGKVVTSGKGSGHHDHDSKHSEKRNSHKHHEQTLSEKWVKWRFEKEKMRDEMMNEGEVKCVFTHDEITAFLGPEDSTAAHTKHKSAHSSKSSSTTGDPVDKWLKFRNKRDSLKRKMEIEGISKDEIHAFLGYVDILARVPVNPVWRMYRSVGLNINKGNAAAMADAQSHGKTAGKRAYFFVLSNVTVYLLVYCRKATAREISEDAADGNFGGRNYSGDANGCDYH